MPNLSDYLLPDGRYYFDNAATTKMSKEALRVYNETAEKWFMNPMSYKDFDPEIERLLEGAREHVAEFVGGNPNKDRVIFTSGATESINLLLKGYFFENFQQKRKIITSQIEHKAVLETCKYLETIGAEIEYVNITSEGVVDYDHLETIVDRETLFVCLMHVNNETGEVSDLERIYDITQAANTKFFTDTTQSITKLEVNAKYFDACVGSAHKFHGPKGVGFLFMKDVVIISPVKHGGNQEGLMRPGTHDLPNVLSMKIALSDVKIKLYQTYFDEIIQLINRKGFQFELIGMKSHILLIDINSYHLQELKKLMIYSRGSACSSGILEQSRVYKQVYPQNESIIRISL
tara:strand:- start:623 stop:1663 length:1041 start_codon:yes stop_codon:yes gene_type:complete